MRAKCCECRVHLTKLGSIEHNGKRYCPECYQFQISEDLRAKIENLTWEYIEAGGKSPIFVLACVAHAISAPGTAETDMMDALRYLLAWDEDEGYI